MSKLLTVVGATGNQGLSLITAALKDGTYKLRALTRNPSSDKAKDLASKGVEVVKVDLNSEQSLLQAFQGSNAIFAVTDFFESFATIAGGDPEKAIVIESSQGINIAKAVSKTPTVEHYIWSTVPNSERISNGKYSVPHFTAKNIVDDFIKDHPTLLAKTTFLWPGIYASNFQYPVFTPNALKTSDKYVQFMPCPPDVPLRSIGSPLANIGYFILASLLQPHITLPGKFVNAFVEETTTGKMLADWTEATGKKTLYVQVSLETFDELWPGWGKEMGVMLKLWDEFRDEFWISEGPLITKEELGLTEMKFSSVKDAYKDVDWEKML